MDERRGGGGTSNLMVKQFSETDSNLKQDIHIPSKISTNSSSNRTVYLERKFLFWNLSLTSWATFLFPNLRTLGQSFDNATPLTLLFTYNPVQPPPPTYELLDVPRHILRDKRSELLLLSLWLFLLLLWFSVLLVLNNSQIRGESWVDVQIPLIPLTGSNVWITVSPFWLYI